MFSQEIDNNDLLFPPTPPMDLLSDSNSNSSHSDSKVSSSNNFAYLNILNLI